MQIFEYVKNIALDIKGLFISRPITRTGSVEVTSKQKKEFQPKKPLSIDSKQRQLKLKAPDSKKSLIKVNNLDPASSRRDEKDTAGQIQRQASSYLQKNVNVPLQSKKSENDQNLLEGLSQFQEYPLKIQAKEENLPKGKQIFPNFDDTLFHRYKKQEGKVLVCKLKSAEKIKRVQEICVVCKMIVSRSDSLKLACLHRYHKTCEIRMRERNNSYCNLCTTRNNHVSLRLHK